MKSKKAYIKLDGKIGEKEQSAIEFVDKDYVEKMHKQRQVFNELLSEMKNRESKGKP